MFKKVLKGWFRRIIIASIPEMKGVLKNKSGLRIINTTLGKFTKIYPEASLRNCAIGDYTYISKKSIISNTVIGKFCSIGPNFFSGWGVHPSNGISTHPMFYSTLKQNGMTLSSIDKIEEKLTVKIGNDVFIGANVTVLDGVSIGDGAIIGAGAVVSKDIPPFAIAVGSPIKIIKYRFEDEVIDKLLKLKWWDEDERILKKVEENFFKVNDFLKNLN